MATKTSEETGTSGKIRLVAYVLTQRGEYNQVISDFVSGGSSVKLEISDRKHILIDIVAEDASGD